MEENQKEIDLINSIIATAVEHGGDPGGPYYICEEELVKSIYKWLEFRKLLPFYDVKIIETERHLEVPQITGEWINREKKGE